MELLVKEFDGKLTVVVVDGGGFFYPVKNIMAGSLSIENECPRIWNGNLSFQWTEVDVRHKPRIK